jgi:ornithine decarboxylase
MKANSAEAVLKVINEAAGSFEAASKYELEMLKRMNIPGSRIVYGTAVKPTDHIKAFVEYGVDRFAFDSECELRKILASAPEARVFVRALVNDESRSVFRLSERFGVAGEEAVDLLKEARDLGAIPYGISFNVGSQAHNREAWANGIKDVAKMMKMLLENRIKIEAVNLGGGFPHPYENSPALPSLEEIGESIASAISELPYSTELLVEPGRGLIAGSVVGVASIIGKKRRSNGHWLYLDMGVYNGLLEALSSQGRTRYRIELLGKSWESKTEEFIVSGPTGDNLDVVHEAVILPANTDTGDRLLIRDVGAYSFALATGFNGFPGPSTLVV